MSSLIETLTDEVSDLLAPLTEAVDNPFRLAALFDGVGAPPAMSTSDPVLQAVRALVLLRNNINTVAASSLDSPSGLANLLHAVEDATTAARALGSAQGPGLESFGADLMQRLTCAHLRMRHPLLFRLAVLAGVIQTAEDLEQVPAVVANGQLVRLPFERERIRFDQLSALARDPSAVLRAEYAPNGLATVSDANAVADNLFGRLARLLMVLGVPCSFGVPTEDRGLLGEAADLVDHALFVRVPPWIVEDVVDAGVILSLSSADRGDLGLVLCPFGGIDIKPQVDEWQLELALGAELRALAIGRHGVTLLASPGTTEVSGRMAAARVPDPEGLAFVFGPPKGTRLEIGAAQVSAEFGASASRADVRISAVVSTCALVVAAEGDGILATLLPSDGTRVAFDLGLEWSNEGGLRWRGGAGLDVSLPGTISFGPLKVEAVRLGLTVDAQKARALVACALQVRVGPLEVAIEGLGVQSTVSFAAGNLGMVGFDYAFAPPTGIGLRVDTPIVEGGGLLRYEPDQKRYSGSIELGIASKWTLKGFGIIASTPSGKTSVIAFATLEIPADSPGFNVTGVGAFVGTHRRADRDACERGLHNGDIVAVMFASDPIGQAPQIIGALEHLFPVADGSHLLGLLVQVTFGSAHVVEADLGAIVQLSAHGAIQNVYLLLEGTIELPGGLARFLSIHVSGFGDWDVGKGEFELRLALHDSKFLDCVLTGEGLILYYRVPGSEDSGSTGIVDAKPGTRQAIVSLGGYHPDYHPPARAVVTKRLGLVVTRGDWLRLQIDQYVALTPGSYQYGVYAKLDIHFVGFGLHGDIGFDALIGFDWSFDIAFHASLALDFHGHTVAGASVDAHLIGPGPTTLKGHASVSVLWWDVSKHFCKEIGWESSPPKALPDVAGQLRAAVVTPQSWLRSPIDGVALTNVTRPGQIWASPSAPLRMQQQVVPLGLPIDRFGASRLPAPEAFTIDQIQIGPQAPSAPPVEGEFGSALYFDLTDDQKLAAVGFERYTAGFEIGGDAVALGDSVASAGEYEDIVIDSTRPAPPARARAPFRDALWPLATALSPKTPSRPPSVPLVRVLPRRFAVLSADEAPPPYPQGVTFAAALVAARRTDAVVVRLDEVTSP